MAWGGPLPALPLSLLTSSQLHPCTDLVDRGCVADEEQAEADDGANDEEHGQGHKEHGSLESSRGDGGEVQWATLADELRGQHVAHTVGEKAEVACLWCVDTITDPVGLDEEGHDQHREADGECAPHHTHGPRVPHIVGMVDPGCFLGRQQLYHGEGAGPWAGACGLEVGGFADRGPEGHYSVLFGEAEVRARGEGPAMAQERGWDKEDDLGFFGGKRSPGPVSAVAFCPSPASSQARQGLGPAGAALAVRPLQLRARAPPPVSSESAASAPRPAPRGRGPKAESCSPERAPSSRPHPPHILALHSVVNKNWEGGAAAVTFLPLRACRTTKPASGAQSPPLPSSLAALPGLPSPRGQQSLFWLSSLHWFLYHSISNY